MPAAVRLPRPPRVARRERLLPAPFEDAAILALVFYGIVTPIGLGMRALGRDPMSRFEEAAARRERPSALAEMRSFLKHNRKWWLLPIILAALFVGSLILHLLVGSRGLPLPALPS